MPDFEACVPGESCPPDLQNKINSVDHSLGRLEGKVLAIEEKLEVVYEKVIVGDVNEPLTTQVARLAENAQEDRVALEKFEQKIEEYHKAQVKDLLEIKEAIHNLGIVGLLFKSGGWKLLTVIAIIVVLVDVVVAGVLERQQEPRILSDEAALERLIDIIENRTRE